MNVLADLKYIKCSDPFFDHFQQPFPAASDTYKAHKKLLLGIIANTGNNE